jgi:hypothetical protein
LAQEAGVSISKLMSDWAEQRTDPRVVCVCLTDEEAVLVASQAASRGLRTAELIRIAVTMLAHKAEGAASLKPNPKKTP